MNSNRVFWALLCSVLISFSATAQSMETIAPVGLSVGDAVTTTLLFPYAIKKASWCSPYFAVQQTKEVNNLLEIKWTSPGHAPSNLSVVTSDGQFYSFLIVYDDHPEDLSFRFGKEAKQPVVQLSNIFPNEQQLQSIADVIKKSPSGIHRQYRSELLKGRLEGIFASEGITWFKIRLKNMQSIPQLVSGASLRISNQVKMKSSVEHPQMIMPIFPSEPISIQRRPETLIIGFPHSMVSRRNQMHLQFSNASGARMLTCKIPYRLLLKAQPISYH